MRRILVFSILLYSSLPANATEIRIDFNSVEREISPLVRGVNCKFFPRRAFTDTTGQLHPLLIERCRSTGISFLNYPAGALNVYHWVRGIGPNRANNIYFHKKSGRYDYYPYKTFFGTDEFLQLCEAIGAEPMLIVNFGTGTSREACAWVAYVNGDPGDTREIGVDECGTDWKTVGYWASLRAHPDYGNHPEPYNVKYWDIGCEMYIVLRTSWAWNHDPYSFYLERYFFGGGAWHHKDSEGGMVVLEDDWRYKTRFSSGEPSQKKYVKFPPVEDTVGSPTVYVDGVPWTRVDDISQAGPEDPVYQFDFQKGEILFGDGVHGKIPPKGAEIRATYKSGPHDGFIGFANKMRLVDSTIQIGSTVSDTGYFDVINENADYVSLEHHYYRYGQDSTTDLDTIHRETMRWPYWFESRLSNWRRYVDNNDNDAPYLWLAMTEYNMHPYPHYSDEPPSPHYAISLDHGLWMAGNLKAFITSGIYIASMWEFVTWEATNMDITHSYNEFYIFDGFQTGYIRRPASYVYELYAKHFGDSVVSATVIDPPMFTYRDNEWPYLDAVASKSLNGDTLYLIVINKASGLDTDTISDIEATIKIDGFIPRQEAKIWTLTGDSITSFNAPGHEFDVCIAESTISQVSDSFAYIFPAHSVTAMELIEKGTSIEDQKDISKPSTAYLFQNYPNPFNSKTIISYQLPAKADVSLKIFNILGREVRTLVNKKQSKGSHSVVWDGKNELGEYVGSGIYFYRLEAGNDFSQTKKLLILR